MPAITLRHIHLRYGSATSTDPGALSRLLTNRIPWQDFNSWFTQRGSGIKSTLEISGA